MTPKELAKGLLLTIGILIGVCLCIWMIYTLSQLITYVVISAVVVLMAQTPVDLLTKKWKFARIWAVSLTLLLFLGLFLGIFILTLPSVAQQAQQISHWNTGHIQQQFLRFAQQLDVWGAAYNWSVSSFLETQEPSKWLKFVPQIMETVLGWIGEMGMGMVAVLFLSFFILKDQHAVNRLILALAPASHHTPFMNTISSVKQLLSRYLLGLLLQSTLVFLMYFLVLWILGTEHAFLLAFLGALFNVIPYIGPLLTSAMVLMLTLLEQFHGQWTLTHIMHTGTLLLGVFGVQLIDNYVSQPLIFSRIVRSHPLELFLVTLSFGLMFGLVGMIIAIPTYTILKVIAREFLPDHPFIRILTYKL